MSPTSFGCSTFWARGARTRMTPTLRHIQRFQATRLCIQCDIKGSHTKACNFLAQPSSVRAKATGQDRACADHTHTTVHHGLACAGSIRRPRADHTPHHRSSRSGMLLEASGELALTMHTHHRSSRSGVVLDASALLHCLWVVYIRTRLCGV